MCGIAGVVGSWPGLDLAAFRDHAFAVMACRGPDGRGATVLRDGAFTDATTGPIERNASALLVHLRLSILDLTEAGAQPMRTSNGRAALTYNGEVYNFESLAESMGLRQGDLRGHSDTEVLLHWLGRGRSPVEMRGMFALAHLEADQGRLTLLRDAYGIKPLFFVRRGGALAFASDVRVLLTLPGVERTVAEVRVLEYLRYGGPTTPMTGSAFAEIDAVAPGERVVVQLTDGALTRSAWYDQAEGSRYGGSFEQAVRDVREAFLESVRLHLKSDVRVGCALSGGIDSSAILCGMRHILGSGGDLHAVSHVADDTARSEERWIDLVATAAGATVHKVRPKPADLVADVDDLIATQGEPIGTTSLFAQYGVFRRARAAQLTVMLDGQGADELLAGYTHYRGLYVSELVRTGGLFKAWAQMRSPHARAATTPRAVAMLAMRGHIPTALADRLGSYLGAPGLPEWIRPPSMEAYYSAQEERRASNSKGLVAALRGSVRAGLVGLLRNEDRNSMRFSVESRVPFLEPQFVRLIQSLPSSYLFGPSGESKYVFRQAMRGIVPDAVLDRRDKIGFENDEAIWLGAAAGWATRVIESAGTRSRFVDGASLRAGWQRFVAGETVLAPRLWATLFFLRWHEAMDARD